MMEEMMVDVRQELLDHVNQAIVAIQNIHNDSRTPFLEAIKLVRPLRCLTLCRHELETPAVTFDTGVDYSEAIAKLKKVGRTLKSHLVVRHEHIDFAALSGDAVSAALKVTVKAIP